MKNSIANIALFIVYTSKLLNNYHFGYYCDILSYFRYLNDWTHHPGCRAPGER